MEPSTQPYNKRFELMHDNTAQWYVGAFIHVYERENGVFERYELLIEDNKGDALMENRQEFEFVTIEDLIHDFYIEKEARRGKSNG